jgi:hypothetical protein
LTRSPGDPAIQPAFEDIGQVDQGRRDQRRGFERLRLYLVERLAQLAVGREGYPVLLAGGYVLDDLEFPLLWEARSAKTRKSFMTASTCPFLRALKASVTVLKVLSSPTFPSSSSFWASAAPVVPIWTPTGSGRPFDE